MPKETVYDRDTPYHRITVGWNRDPGGVGLTAVMDTPCDDGSELVKGGTPVDVHLDRDGINRLIRTLRKARDAAYGADA